MKKCLNVLLCIGFIVFLKKKKNIFILLLGEINIKVKKYIKKIAKKYDTVGAERTFMTFDDRPAIISGGDYGWKTDIEKTAAELLEYIKDSTIDVIEPVYTQTAVSRSKNDIGYSYLEIMWTESRLCRLTLN